MVMSIIIALFNLGLIFAAGRESSLMDSLGRLDNLADNVVKTNQQVPLYSNLIEYNAIKQNSADKIFLADGLSNKQNDQKSNITKKTKFFFDLDDKLFEKKISFCFFLVITQIYKIL